MRCDTTPLQVAAAYRTQRRSWLTMTEKVGALLDEYPGPAAHDETGAGSAIGAFPARRGTTFIWWRSTPCGTTG